MLTIFDGPAGAVQPLTIYEVADLVAPGGRALFINGGDCEADLAAVRMAADRPVYLRHSWLQLVVDNGLTNPVLLHRNRILERLALANQVVRVVCLPSATITADPDYPRQRAAYTEAASFPTRLPTVICRGDEPAIALAGIIESMRLPANEGPGIGAWRPGKSVLLIGDWPSRKASPSELGPFTAWNCGGYSSWLSRQLEKGDIPERCLYWVNAYDDNGSPRDARFIDDLRPCAVVTLGETASDWLIGEGVPSWVYQRHHRVPHPNRWRYMRAGDPYDLTDMLKRILATEEKPA